MMDPFRTCVALGPLAIYLIVLSALNFRRRPVVVSGARDTAMLGLGLCGLVFVGPVEMLLPKLDPDAAPYAWLLLVVGYCMLLTLGVLLSKPRIVVYNAALGRLRPALADAVNELDGDARWAGTSVSLPKLHVEFYLDDHPSTRNISLVATGAPQSYGGWRMLEARLRSNLRAGVEMVPNVWAFGVLAMALAIATRIGWLCINNGQEITQGFVELMRFR